MPRIDPPKRKRPTASKLSEQQVREMRQAYKDGATQSSLAVKYHVNVSHVGRIVRREMWQGVGEE